MKTIKLHPEVSKLFKTYSPEKILYGGRNSGKTYQTAVYLSVLSCAAKIRVLAVRQFQNRIDQSVYTVLKKVITEQKIEDSFTFTKSSIINNITGSEFFFHGIRRNIEDIKGVEDVDILWIEEGEDLTYDQWKIISPTIRKDYSFTIIIFNPKFVTDFVWSHFIIKKSKRRQILKLNYIDNKHISQKSLDEIMELKSEDPEEYNHIYLGQPKQDDNESIIKRRWLMSCIDAHKVLNIDATGGKRIGYDVADSGDDLNSMAVMNGSILDSLDVWSGGDDELYESAVRVHNKAYEINAIVNYDSNGLGAGVGSNIKNINTLKNTNVEYYGFNSASNPRDKDEVYYIEGVETQQTNGEYFENLKAQAWWALRDKVKATHRAVTKGENIHIDDLFSINSEIENIEELITELSTPRKKQSGRLKNMVEKKEDLKKRSIKSPNMADSVVYANFDISEVGTGGVSFNDVSIF